MPFSNHAERYWCLNVFDRRIKLAVFGVGKVVSFHCSHQNNSLCEPVRTKTNLSGNG